MGLFQNDIHRFSVKLNDIGVKKPNCPANPPNSSGEKSNEKTAGVGKN